jgi:hypothetical protein
MMGPSTTIDFLARGLESLVLWQTRDGMPVVNETGLDGTYEVRLEFAPVTVFVVAFVATWIPARQAAAVHPNEALRSH